MKPESKERSLLQTMLREQLSLESETSWFLLLGVLDLFLTAVLLKTGAVRESNPVARFFLSAAGIRGLVAFKCLVLMLVTVAAQIIALRHVKVAQAVLLAGIVSQFLVVVYSLTLLARVIF